MKKAMAILLAAVLALACTACGGSKNGETKDRLAQIKEKGYIELCTEPYFAPYEYVDPNKSGEDQYQGMDIEVARYIADKIGVDLKITALDFTAVLAGVADGKYDFAISAIAYAPPGRRPCGSAMCTTPPIPAMASSSGRRTLTNITTWIP